MEFHRAVDDPPPHPAWVDSLTSQTQHCAMFKASKDYLQAPEANEKIKYTVATYSTFYQEQNI